jgi:large subunit ribosomal protein L5
MQRLKKFYLEKVFPEWAAELKNAAPNNNSSKSGTKQNGILSQSSAKHKIRNLHQIPRVEKIVINRGLGADSTNAKTVDASLAELTQISGQKSVVCLARKSVAGFGIREEMPVGMKVTLRGARMYAFLDRLINLAFPRIRDFQGLSPQSFDGYGNYSLGLREQLMFPEVDYESIDKSRGMDISIVTSAQTDAQALDFLKALGMPFAASESSPSASKNRN